jgi:hypothetical protein
VKEAFSWTTPAAFGCAVINQTNRESLERFKRAVAGLGKIYGPYEPAIQGQLVA